MPIQAQEGAGVPTNLRPLYPRESPGTHCKRGWVGLGDDLSGTFIVRVLLINSLKQKI